MNSVHAFVYGLNAHATLNLRVQNLSSRQLRKPPSFFADKIALRWDIWHKNSPYLLMKKETTKTNETELLELLKRVLPKATHDAQLAGKIYQAIELELKAKARAKAF